MDGGLAGCAPLLEALEADASLGLTVRVKNHGPRERGAPPATMRRALEASFELVMIQQIRGDAELPRRRHPAVDIQLLTPAAGAQRVIELTILSAASSGGQADVSMESQPAV